jgi:methylase of polypeptide subunit release factors
VLAVSGVAVFEIGAGQAGRVSDILTQHGFEDIEPYEDLAGIPRCLVAGQKASGSAKKTVGKLRASV